MIGRMPVRHQTLCFVFRHGDHGQRQILLGRKKKGFGAGKIMGLGGHVDPGESEADCAVREVHEEAGIVVAPGDASWRAEFNFVFPARPEWNAIVTVFFAEQWRGQIEGSDEITPEWFEVDSLPFDQMWDDESHWLPRALAGELLTGTITYDDSCTLVSHAELELVERLCTGKWFRQRCPGSFSLRIHELSP
jgi:8-oxo-dGTP diphosphatase